MNERTLELADQAAEGMTGLNIPDEFCKKFADLIRADEREACAKLCESHVRYPSRLHFAAAIRARGNT